MQNCIYTSYPYMAYTSFQCHSTSRGDTVDFSGTKTLVQAVAVTVAEAVQCHQQTDPLVWCIRHDYLLVVWLAFITEVGGMML
jgi:hypothetical protein